MTGRAMTGRAVPPPAAGGTAADPIGEATRAQDRASDPRRSVWVGASAGTGKTTVLIRRILRLMLDGAPPSRILSLTFTKAAAAEMRNRLSDQLARWAVVAPDRLDDALRLVTGGPPTDRQRVKARTLFAEVLDVPGGLKIQTIHAFCQSVLRRFPLEAGVSPHFEVMDDRSAGETLLEAREALLLDTRAPDAASEAGLTLAAALDIVTADVGEEGFSALMALMASERGRLKRLRTGGGDLAAIAARLERRLDLQPGLTADAILAAACDDAAFAAAALRRVVADGLRVGGKTDQARATTIATWLAADRDGRAATIDAYTGAYITRDGMVSKRLATKAVLAATPDALDVLGAEAARLLAVGARLRARRLADRTIALLRLAFGMLDHYDRRKAARGLLDYDDLILATDRLLRQGAAWVLYKLDGGIDHMLIDEAQDTNPDQWAIIEALAGEFFADAGAGARTAATTDSGPRTLFAVGDVKQSIYSFQRADPEAFTAVHRRFRARVEAIDRDGWATVPMRTSFRSTQAVLTAVDAVFGRGAARDGVALDREDVRHLVARAGQAGLVEIWPVLVPPPPPPAGTWLVPASGDRAGDREGEAASPPDARLAGAIAGRIADWLARGEMLESRGRPIRAGDIMILVRRRTAFVDRLVRQLKARAVPVAGVDRMVLTDQLAVMDMLAVANFLLLPRDDLALATVLKGPFVGLDEDGLMRLVLTSDGSRRGGRLWDLLDRVRDEDPRYGMAADFLGRLLDRADFVPPFELFADLLAMAVPAGPSGRAALLGRLGLQAEDPLEEFMALALAYQRGHPPALQGFVQWIAASPTEVKRDLDQTGRDEVRVMTVHGAKGLQAPIVFLPDSTTTPRNDRRLFWLPEGAHGPDVLPLWSPRRAVDDPVAANCREDAGAAQMAEYARLLYVAMTRAEDRLYVCGWVGRRQASPDCWHDMVSAGLAALADPVDARTLPGLADVAPAYPDAPFDGLRFSGPQAADPVPDPAPAAVTMVAGAETPPDWAFMPAPAEPDPPRPLLPSAPGGDETPTRSPARQAVEAARFGRGVLIHRLLQTLPDLPPPRRTEAGGRWLASPVHGLDAARQAEILSETLAVMAEPAFAPLFGPGSRAEVPVTGLVGRMAPDGSLVPQVIAGQIDRLWVSGDRVLVVDFKTLRPPPSDPARVASAYLHQMAAYRALIAAVYPDRLVDCALLWTDAPRLMPLPAALLDAQGFRPVPG